MLVVSDLLRQMVTVVSLCARSEARIVVGRGVRRLIRVPKMQLSSIWVFLPDSAKLYNRNPGVPKSLVSDLLLLGGPLRLLKSTDLLCLGAALDVRRSTNHLLQLFALEGRINKDVASYGIKQCSEQHGTRGRVRGSCVL